MAHLRNLTRLALAPVVLASPIAIALLGGFSTSACEAYHNEAERAAYKKALDAEEAKLYPEIGAAGAGNYTTFVYSDSCPNGVCVPDPGSRIIGAKECKETEKGIEFLPMPIWDFAGAKGTASYSYHDRTVFNLMPRGWELLNTRQDLSKTDLPSDPWQRCNLTGNSVLHVTGGPFLQWGGGIGRSLRCSNKYDQKAIPLMRLDELTTAYCPEIFVGYDDLALSKMSPVCDSPQNYPLNESACPERDRKAQAGEAIPDSEVPLLGQALDLSTWEGISFWARRGPNGQAGIRILVADRYTDDDISFRQFLADPSAPRHCERTVECRCTDTNKPCHTLTAEDLSEYTGRDDQTVRHPKVGEQVCWDPMKDPKITRDNSADLQWQVCGDTACDWPSASAKSLNAGILRVPPDPEDPFYYRDLQFAGMKCQPYSQRGSITTDFCYDPNSSDPRMQTPPEGSQQCGDHWMKSVELGYDWKFYMVPFKELLQQGWAKRSYMLDLTAVTMVRITWDRGFADFWVDDVRVYRKQQ